MESCPFFSYKLLSTGIVETNPAVKGCAIRNSEISIIMPVS